MIENQVTPARLYVDRDGFRPTTESYLQMRLDHGNAVDSVYGKVKEEIIHELNLVTVRTKAHTRDIYLKRPDLGRKIHHEDLLKIHTHCLYTPQIQVLFSDGLSAFAFNNQAKDTYHSFQEEAIKKGFQLGTPIFIDKGRVGAMDHIGELLQPEVVVYFIGERPGLVASDSMSAYLCYKPRAHTIESDRKVVSNIHGKGTLPKDAGKIIMKIIEEMYNYHQAELVYT